MACKLCLSEIKYLKKNDSCEDYCYSNSTTSFYTKAFIKETNTFYSAV